MAGEQQRGRFAAELSVVTATLHLADGREVKLDRAACAATRSNRGAGLSEMAVEVLRLIGSSPVRSAPKGALEEAAREGRATYSLHITALDAEGVNFPQAGEVTTVDLDCSIVLIRPNDA
jgi:hypothetical protein